MTQYFEIRDAHDGEVVAIWRKENDNHQLIFGVKDVVYPLEKEDDKRTSFMSDERVIECTLMNHITEPEFSVLDDIAEIPHILSDGVLHHLGVLKWRHEWHAFLDGWHRIDCSGAVYAKVIDLEAPDVIAAKVRAAEKEAEETTSIIPQDEAPQNSA